MRRSLLMLAFVMTTRVAQGEPTVVPLRIAIDSPCTTESDFAERLGARSKRIVVAPEATKADALAITIRPGPNGWDGTLRIDGEGGERTRSVAGASCEEVTDALSLAVALTYDPDALSPKPAAPPPPPPPPPPAPVVRAAERPAPVPPPPRPLRWSMGVLGSIQASRPVPLGASAFGEVASPGGASARLAFGVQRGSIDVGDASARFTWALVVPDLCPVHLARGPFSIAPCLGLALGVLSAEPRDIPNGESYARAWIAPRPMIRMRWTLGRSFAVEAQGSVDVPLVRGRYTFGDVTAYAIPVVVPQAGLGGAFDLR